MKDDTYVWNRQNDHASKAYCPFTEISMLRDSIRYTLAEGFSIEEIRDIAWNEAFNLWRDAHQD